MFDDLVSTFLKTMVSQSAPGIYTNVANHIGWIEDQVKQSILIVIVIFS